MSRAKVEALLNPANVVVVGATDKPGNWAWRTWRNLHRYNFPHKVYPLNPARDSVWDTRCYRSFGELPEKPDHLVIIAPAKVVPGTLRDAAAAGARSATIFTSGFDEAADDAGRALGRELHAAIAETGLAVCGPNCMGNINGHNSFVTMVDDRPIIVGDGPAAVIGQSGGIVMSLKRTLEDRGVRVGHLITSGNETGLNAADYIDYFADDPNTKVVLAYLESVHNPDTFLAALRRARANGKAVVVMKLGASDAGREAAAAHTGALAGRMEAFDAVAGAAGAIRARNLDDAVEAVDYFAHAKLPKGRGLGAITFSGGFRALLLDGADAHGLSFPPLHPKTTARLNELLREGSIIGNPLDAGFAALRSTEVYLACVNAMLEDPGVDLLMLQQEPPQAPGLERREEDLKAIDRLAASAGKPIACTIFNSHGQSDHARALRTQLPHLPFLQEVDKTLRVLRGVVDFAVPAAPPSRTLARKGGGNKKLFKKLPASGALTEIESKALLKAYGVAIPREVLATSADDAARAAKKIGFPVVLKIVSRAITHKSDVGGVVVGLQTAAAVRAAYRKIVAAARRKAKGAEIDGVLVAQQVAGGHELVLGVARDPEMGPVIMFGSGGVALELYKDVAFAPCPLDAAGAAALIDRTKAGRIVAGYRGAPPLDRAAAVRALVGLSRLAADLGDRLAAIDINPFVLKPRGGVALDALIVVR